MLELVLPPWPVPKAHAHTGSTQGHNTIMSYHIIYITRSYMFWPWYSNICAARHGMLKTLMLYFEVSQRLRGPAGRTADSVTRALVCVVADRDTSRADAGARGAAVPEGLAHEGLHGRRHARPHPRQPARCLCSAKDSSRSGLNILKSCQHPRILSAPRNSIK